MFTINSLIKNIYLASPFFIKKLFANIEGVRRNIYRRGGEYSKHYNSIDLSLMFSDYNQAKQTKDINALLIHVKQNIPFYKEKLNVDSLKSMNDIEHLPLTSKYEMRENIKKFINEDLLKTYWKCSTSGSTGTPFTYYRDKRSMQYEYALYDKLYEYLSGGESSRKARISGVNIVSADVEKPPFWYFIKVFNQLQCSAYHIDQNTYNLYVEALKKYKIELGVGYPSAWLFLAQYMMSDNDIKLKKLKAIVTDSEGISIDEKQKVENAFNCPLFQTYGLSEVGMLAVQCENNHYHIFTNRCYIEIVDDNGKKVINGELGEIVVTDLHSYNAPFIRYRTGDNGILEDRDCGCGWKTPYIKELCGRIDDYIVTAEGRKVRRLGHIAKPARGVIGMQLIQSKPGFLDINVLPSKSFETESMDDVLKVAKDYLGDMNITWKTVTELEKSKSGKVKYVVRKF